MAEKTKFPGGDDRSLIERDIAELENIYQLMVNKDRKYKFRTVTLATIPIVLSIVGIILVKSGFQSQGVAGDNRIENQYNYIRLQGVLSEWKALNDSISTVRDYKKLDSLAVYSSELQMKASYFTTRLRGEKERPHLIEQE